jgi:oligogalacturonide transporter
MRIGIPLYILGIFLLCLYRADWVEWPVFIFCAMIGIGVSGCQTMPWILFPDIVDVGELKLNDRPTGSFSGLMTFIKKSTSAIAIFITSWVLDLAGFRRPVVDYSTGLVTKFDQPLSAEWGFRLVILITVVVFISFAYFFAKNIKLYAKRSRKIKEFIELQKQGTLDKEHMSEEDYKEYQAIQKDLF